jgi:putative NIF3 family GTP cyclohydrolase 1 type 2
MLLKDLTAKLDNFFALTSFSEGRDHQPPMPTGYESVLKRFATATFLEGGWNGLMLNNSSTSSNGQHPATLDRVYMVVFPSQGVLDMIIAREVERGAPGAMIFSHHIADYQESGPGSVYITEPQLEELREHRISYYVCHAPLDCHHDISTSGAIAHGLRLKDQIRFAPYLGGLSGVAGVVANPVGFHDFARKVQELLDLPYLRYNAIRHNGRKVHRVGVIAGFGGTPADIQEAVDLGCDTFITGEWWPFGPGDWRVSHRDKMREFLANSAANINLIGTSHYASEALVLQEHMLAWFRSHHVEAIFVGQDDPWR